MTKAIVNNQYSFMIEDEMLEKDFDLIKIRDGIFHAIKNNKSYNAEVLKINTEEKTVIIRVNGNKYTVQLKDKYDELLEKLGMSSASSVQIKEIKAPMPGLVLDVRIKESDSVKKGDPLVVLEAMKMENIIKSPGDLSIKKVFVKKGDTIEKNHIMISFV